MSLVRSCRERVQHGRERGASAIARLEARTGEPSLIGTALRAVDLDRRRAGGVLAGGIAFRAFLWLLPSALLATGLIGLVRDISHDRPEAVARRVGLSGVVGHYVADASKQSSRGTVLLLGFGFVLTVYLGMGLVRAMRITCVIAWDLPLVRRPHVLRDGVLLTLALGTQLLASAVTSHLRDTAGNGEILVTLAAALIGGVIWFSIALLLPHGDAPPSALVPGALLMALALQVLYLVTVYYFSRRIESAGELYGPLGVAATLLLWLYIVARLFVIASFFDAALWQRMQEQRREAEAFSGPG
jgi:membrane protein